MFQAIRSRLELRTDEVDGAVRDRARGPLVAAMAGAVLAALAMAPAASASTGPGPLISPADGDVVRSHRVLIRVRSSDATWALSATLNGVKIHKQFAPARRHIRTLRASISHGLRLGHNELVVRVRRRHAPTRRATSHFFVRRSKPLVGAGIDRRLVVGAPARAVGRVINGRASSLRWDVVKAPGPEAARSAVTGRASAGPVLDASVGRAARFTPSTPGRYVLQLTHGRGGGPPADRVAFDAVPPNPLVAIDTGNAATLSVGDRSFAVDTGRDQITVLVLSRKTLAFKSRNSYSFAQAASLASDLSRLDNSNLVIVAARDVGAISPTAIEALKGIGVPEPGLRPFAAIGVPGFKPGSADTSATPPGDTIGAPARLKGYLTPDQYLNYGFVSTEKAEFALGADKALDCPSQCGVKAGYRLSIRDPYTHAELPGHVFDFETGGDGADQWATGLAEALESAPRGSVVSLQSYSTINPATNAFWPPVAGVPKQTMKRIAEAVAAVGGTRNAFNRAATVQGKSQSDGHVYQLVGWKGAVEGEGAEAAAGVDGAGDAPEISGVMRPGRDSQLRPTEAALSDDPENAIADLAMKPPTSTWPLDDDPGAKAALAWLGSQDESLGPDPRSAYWTQDLDINALTQKLALVNYPTDKADSFTREQFEAAKQELLRELGWVGKVDDYFTRIGKPFDAGALSGWAEIQTIADKIKKDGNPDDGKVTAFWLEISEALLDLIPIVGEEVSTTVRVIEVSSEVVTFGIRVFGATTDGEPPGPETVDANELASELIKQAMDSVGALEGLEDVIVSDYEKLSTLGPHADCNVDGQPNCPPEFAFSKADRVTASRNLTLTVRREGYLKLLPLGYRVFYLINEGASQGPTPPDPKNYYCAGEGYPWYYYPDLPRSSTAMLTALDPVLSDWDQFVFSRFSRTDYHGAPPSEELLDTLFGKVSASGNPKEGGLGLFWTQFALPEMRKAPADRNYWQRDEDAERQQCRFLAP